MARLPFIDPRDVGADGALANVNLFRAMANHPGMLQGFLPLAMAVYTGTALSPAHREVAYLTTTVLNRCHY